jgi:hypothetical protein
VGAAPAVAAQDFVRALHALLPAQCSADVADLLQIIDAANASDMLRLCNAMRMLQVLRMQAVDEVVLRGKAQPGLRLSYAQSMAHCVPESWLAAFIDSLDLAVVGPGGASGPRVSLAESVQQAETLLGGRELYMVLEACDDDEDTVSTSSSSSSEQQDDGGQLVRSRGFVKHCSAAGSCMRQLAYMLHVWALLSKQLGSDQRPRQQS